MNASSPAVEFLKGHGTGNDFVLLPDPDGELLLTERMVARICDRRFGIGGDGVIRIVRTTAIAEAAQLHDQADWFMDYRNADGSLAAMCGNGSRVFARYLVDNQLVDGDFTIATRAGIHRCREETDGSISVDMGYPTEGPAGSEPAVTLGGRTWPADARWMPNPHAVVFVDDVGALGDLTGARVTQGAERFPDGQNIEFVSHVGFPANRLGDSAGPSARMRVLERGVGETLSCGTGACAVALAVRTRLGVTSAGAVRVDVPGGMVTVTQDSDGRVTLTGPATIVARGTIDPLWWKELA
ncbi:MAG: diaminopimelate epimerase [Candidatus Nanopelagicales bacterium]